MKHFKLASVISAMAIFAIACGDRPDAERASAVNSSATINSPSPAVVVPTPSPITTEATPALTPSPLVSPTTAPTASPAPKPSASPAASPKSTPRPSPSVAAAKTVDVAEARQLYQRACSSCHGRGGEGNPNGVPSIKKLGKSDQYIAAKIANGGNGMPAYKGSLSREQIAGLVRLIRSGL